MINDDFLKKENSNANIDKKYSFDGFTEILLEDVL